MQNIVNGVDRDAIFATIDAIKQDAGVAAFEFRVENEWVGGGYNRTTIRDFHGAHQDVAHDQVFEVYNDEPPVLLSGDKGPNPVENLLHALAGCLTTSIVYHAAAQGKKVDAVRSRFEGDIDLRGFLGISDKVRNGYSGIRVVFEIEGDLSVIAEDMARIAAE
jgi:uncharacterized OsmC-like protein